jgi:hypothetical protein
VGSFIRPCEKLNTSATILHAIEILNVCDPDVCQWCFISSFFTVGCSNSPLKNVNIASPHRDFLFIWWLIFKADIRLRLTDTQLFLVGAF